MEKNNKIWINILKIIASFNVVINHACILNIGNSNIEILFHCIQLSLSKVAVPIFIMITAVLLIEKKIDFKYIRKKIIKIIIPLIFLSMLTYIIHNETFSFVDFIRKFFIAEIVYPYWYLYMLIGLYLMIPILNKLILNLSKKELLYITVISLIIPSTIYTLEKIFNFYLDLSFTISFFTNPISYYIAGVYITKINLNKKNRNIALLTFILPMIFLIIFTFVNTKGNEISGILDDYKLIITLLPAVSLFYLIRYYFENKKLSLNKVKIINTISSLTFGLYLFHSLYMYRLECTKIIRNLYSINNIFGTIIFEMIVIIIGLIITYVLKKIPIVKKIL